MTVKGVGILTAFVMLGCLLLALLYVQSQLALNQPVNFLIPILLVMVYEVITALLIANKGTLVIRRNRYTAKTPDKEEER